LRSKASGRGSTVNDVANVKRALAVIIYGIGNRKKPANHKVFLGENEDGKLL